MCLTDFLVDGNFHGITHQSGVPSAAAGLLMIINRASEEPQTSPDIYRIIKKNKDNIDMDGLSVCWSFTSVAQSSPF